MSGMVRKGYRVLADLFGKPFYIGVICGGICVLVDIDHPIAVAIGIVDSRFAHPLYFFISCVIIIGCFAFVGGLLYKAVLGRGYA